MSLPPILAPSSAPVFLADGHQVSERSPFARVGYGSGHSRLRRVRTTTERIVTVEWFLDAGVLEEIVEWYEEVLYAGQESFSARVANQDGSGLVYWAARWVAFEYELLELGRARLSGSIYLYGEPSATAPETGEFAAEVGIVLNSSATATIPLEFAVEMSIVLNSQSGSPDFAAEAGIALESSAVVYETLLAAEAGIALDGTATMTVVTGACSPYTVLGDTSISISSGGAIVPLADAGESFDACRDLI